MELTELIQTINPLQFYGLIFLLGSLTVASLSDLRRMAAQQDFAEVWAGFAILLFLYDTYSAITLTTPLLILLAKWLMIVLFAAAATSAKINFNISIMDIAAITALLSLLNPAYIIAALILLLIIGELMQPILRQFGEAGAYPYLPVVLVTTILIILIHFTGILETITPPAT